MPPSSRGTVRAAFTDGHIYVVNTDGQEELYEISDLSETDNKIGSRNHDLPPEHFRATLDRLMRESIAQQP